jgi:hypothetical protein
LFGKWDRAAHLRAGPLGRIHDLRRAGIQHPVIEGFKPNSNVLTLHFLPLRLAGSRSDGPV